MSKKASGRQKQLRIPAGQIARSPRPWTPVLPKAQSGAGGTWVRRVRGRPVPALPRREDGPGEHCAGRVFQDADGRILQGHQFGAGDKELVLRGRAGPKALGASALQALSHAGAQLERFTVGVLAVLQRLGSRGGPAPALCTVASTMMHDRRMRTRYLLCQRAVRRDRPTIKPRGVPQ